MTTASLANKFTFDELENIRINFNNGDRDHDAQLDSNEFSALMSATSQLDTQDIQKLFSLFDKSGNGKISFDEFISTLAILTKGTAAQKLGFMFRFYDYDGDGVLATTEIKTLIKHIARMVESHVGEAKAELIAEGISKRIDTNEDGKISLAEWVAFGTSNPDLLKLFGL